MLFYQLLGRLRRLGIILFRLGFQLLHQLLEVLTLTQGLEVVVVFEMVDVLVALGDGLAEQLDGAGGVLVLELSRGKRRHMKAAGDWLTDNASSSIR